MRIPQQIKQHRATGTGRGLKLSEHEDRRTKQDLPFSRGKTRRAFEIGLSLLAGENRVFHHTHRFEDIEDLWRGKSLYVTAFAPK